MMLSSLKNFLAVTLLWCGVESVSAATDEITRDVFMVAGHVIFTQQLVKVKDQSGAQRFIDTRSNVFIDDVIETEKNSILQMRLSNGSIFELGKNSKLSLGGVLALEPDAKIKHELFLHYGELHLFSGTQPTFRRVLKTTFATIKASKAMFTVVVADKLRILVHTGDVVVKNSAGELRIGPQHSFRQAIVGIEQAPQGQEVLSAIP